MTELINNIKTKFNQFIDEGKDELRKIEKPKNLIKQIPNLFTISRLILIPFIIANIVNGNLLIAGFITLGASVTDLLDGKVARALNATSSFGAKLDAIIDKIFVIFVTTPLFIINPYLIIPVCLDMIIATINGYAHVNNIKTETSITGKIKTVFLDSLIISTFFTNFNIINHISKLLYLSTLMLQTKTAKEYYDNYNNIHLQNIIANNNEYKENPTHIIPENSKDEKNKNNELHKLKKIKKELIHYKDIQNIEVKEKINTMKKR